jgi:hypothetical protein
VARADNFWQGTFSTAQKKRLTATQEKDTMTRLDTDKNFIKLNILGYDRRMVDSYEGTLEEQAALLMQESGPSSIVADVGRATADNLELRSSKDDQFLELQRKQLLNRTGPMKYAPKFSHKYFDYLTSLKKAPTKGELFRNVGLGSLFTLITMINTRANMAFLFSFAGNLAIMSILLSRGMDANQPGAMEGVDPSKKIGWSGSAFKTALGVTGLFSVGAGLSTFMLTSIIPIEFGTTLKLRLSASLAVLSSAYFTSFFEVYEDKSRDGWRWKRSLEGFLPDDVSRKLQTEVFGEKSAIKELYEYTYDPQVDDYPHAPKFLDEVDGSGGWEGILAGGAGEHNEGDSKVHYENWMIARVNARKAPIMTALPEEPWLGGKKGLFVAPEDVPVWLSRAYKKNVLASNKWRGKPQKFKKDTSEFDPVEGSLGFRDKAPEFLKEMFGGNIWETKMSASRKAARAFGSYRKTMYKVDKQVTLMPCDGADKDTNGPEEEPKEKKPKE